MPDRDLIAEAAAARAADVAALADMTERELDYLTRVGELEDPLTDGIECNSEDRH